MTQTNDRINVYFEQNKHFGKSLFLVRIIRQFTQYTNQVVCSYLKMCGNAIYAKSLHFSLKIIVFSFVLNLNQFNLSASRDKH